MQMARIDTLTEAHRQTGVIIMVVNPSRTETSSSRRIPYVEQYHGYSGLYETPVQRLQRAAADEAARAST